MGSFIQIIEFTSSRIDEVRKLGEQIRENRDPSGPAGPTRVTITEDRDRPGHYFNIVEFTSYESAMENSNHPRTQEFARQMVELVDGPPTFYNLDVADTFEP